MTAPRLQFSPETFFRMPLGQLEAAADRPRNFPLFIYLERNDRLLLRFEAGEPISLAQLALYVRNGLTDFWCPVEFLDDWNLYLRESGQQGEDSAPAAGIPDGDASAPVPTPTPTAPPAAVLPIDQVLKPRSELAVEAINIVESVELSDSERSALLSKVARDVAGLLEGIRADDADGLKAVLLRCQEFAEDVVRVAASTHQSREIYDAISLIKVMVPEHSGVSASLAVIFAMGLGHSDAYSLAELSMASSVHDLGLLRVDQEIVSKDWDQLSEEEEEALRGHVAETLDLLDERGVPLTPSMRILIEQHHERHDGTGYPKGLVSFEIDEMASILSVADQMDDYMSGRRGGLKLSPSEAIRRICDSNAFAPEMAEAVAQMIGVSKAEKLGESEAAVA